MVDESKVEPLIIGDVLLLLLTDNKDGINGTSTKYKAELHLADIQFYLIEYNFVQPKWILLTQVGMSHMASQRVGMAMNEHGFNRVPRTHATYTTSQINI